jgi:hypothetical protein
MKKILTCACVKNLKPGGLNYPGMIAHLDPFTDDRAEVICRITMMNYGV